MYWGSYWQPRVVRLNKDMTSLAGPVTTPQGLTEFWEAPWMFERNGTYYMAYASNGGADCVTDSAYACIRYATASDPMGPWTHRGVLLDQVTSTTNHPAVMEFGGQWWMVYHTADAPGGSFTFSRAFFLFLMFLVLAPLVAPVLFVARRHRQAGSDGRYDREMAATGYGFLLAMYVALVITTPADLREDPGGALGAVAEFLYGLPDETAVVPPVAAALLIYLTHRRRG
jgi:hypothetical protein